MLARLPFSLAVILGLLQVAPAAIKVAAAQKPNEKSQLNQKAPLPAQTDQPGTKDQKLQRDQKEAAKPKPIAITPEREAAVTTFVDRNHPELAALLAHLKTKQPKEYERAVRDLFRVTEKLAMVNERDSRQYDLELKVWKAQSRAQLLVARLKMTDPESADREELTNQLREILSEQMLARLEILRFERERVAGRLDKLNEDISRLERDRDSVVEGHLKSLTSAGAKAKQPEKKMLEKRTPEKKPGERKPNPNKP